MAEWIFIWSKAAAIGWAQALAITANAASGKNPSVPKGCDPSGTSPRSVPLQVSRYSQGNAPSVVA
jgi:hypothetical protein